MKVFATATVLSSLFAMVAAAEWKPCGGKDFFKLDSVSYGPVVPGTQVCTSIKGTTFGEVAAGAKLTVKATLRGTIEVFNQEYDFCKELEKVGEACPLAPGSHTLKPCFDVPALAPPGVEVEVTVTGTSALGQEIICATGTVST